MTASRGQEAELEDAETKGRADLDAHRLAHAQPPTLDAGHDVFTALIDWSNGAAPPERITATRFLPRSPTQIDFQRPLCAYPKMPAPGTDHSSGTGGNIVCLSSR